MEKKKKESKKFIITGSIVGTALITSSIALSYFMQPKSNKNEQSSISNSEDEAQTSAVITDVGPYTEDITSSDGQTSLTESESNSIINTSIISPTTVETESQNVSIPTSISETIPPVTENILTDETTSLIQQITIETSISQTVEVTVETGIVTPQTSFTTQATNKNPEPEEDPVLTKESAQDYDDFCEIAHGFIWKSCPYRVVSYGVIYDIERDSYMPAETDGKLEKKMLLCLLNLDYVSSEIINKLFGEYTQSQLIGLTYNYRLLFHMDLLNNRYYTFEGYVIDEGLKKLLIDFQNCIKNRDINKLETLYKNNVTKYGPQTDMLLLSMGYTYVEKYNVFPNFVHSDLPEIYYDEIVELINQKKKSKVYTR